MTRRASAARSELQLSEDLTEADLNKLQLQYVKEEKAKRAYTVKTQGLITRDQREIQRLQDENEELLRSLRVSESFSNRWADAGVVQDLSAMLACENRIDELLEAEKDKSTSLKYQISKWERMLATQAGGRATLNLSKSTSEIENKLDTAHKCFSQMMTKNRELREELKALHLDKKHFLHVQSGLEKELHSLRKDISKLRTQCTEAFSDSVMSQETQKMLMHQNAEDVSHDIKDRNILEKEMSHYSNLEVFLNIKGNTRSNQDADNRKETHKQLDSEETGPEDFKDAFNKIYTETEENDLDTLEEKNFSLLMFVNNQLKEIDNIQRQISQLCSEREIFLAEEQQHQEQHQALCRKVASKQEAIDQQLAGYQQRSDFIEKLTNQLKEGVELLLQMSCDSPLSSEQSASSARVHSENTTEHLRMLEDRVNKFLLMQSALLSQETLNQQDDESFSSTAGQLLGMSPPAVNLRPAAATPAPAFGGVVLPETKDPVSCNDLLTLVTMSIQKNTD